MSDHLQRHNEDKGMRVLCYAISAASVAICILLIIRASLGW
jgi:hypothetical protein